MTRARILWCVSAVVLMTVSATGRAALRINGNQLVEGGGYYISGAQRHQVARASASSSPVVHRLFFNVGQGVIGRGNLPGPPGGSGTIAFAIGIGLMYDVNNVALENNCLVVITGDVNVTGAINSADVIHLVNYAFKSGPLPLPCEAAGDVNCSAAVTAADVIHLVNYVFKGGPPPCNVCFLIPGIWSCP